MLTYIKEWAAWFIVGLFGWPVVAIWWALATIGGDPEDQPPWQLIVGSICGAAVGIGFLW